MQFLDQKYARLGFLGSNLKIVSELIRMNTIFVPPE
jgi:hypothetical protein